MESLKAYYDCQVCGKKHQLKAKWELESEMNLMENWGLEMEEEMKAILLKTAEESFLRMHSARTFDPSRLVFE